MVMEKNKLTSKEITDKIIELTTELNSLIKEGVLHNDLNIVIRLNNKKYELDVQDYEHNIPLHLTIYERKKIWGSYDVVMREFYIQNSKKNQSGLSPSILPNGRNEINLPQSSFVHKTV